MNWWRFLIWDVVGAIVWATGYGLLAYFAGRAVADAIDKYSLYAVRRARRTRRCWHSSDAASGSAVIAKRLNRRRFPTTMGEYRGSTKDRGRIRTVATAAELSAQLELHDPDGAGHAARVTALALRLAEALDASGQRLDAIRAGGPLHDVGKLGVPTEVLQKPGPLAPEEFDQIRTHPVVGAHMLAEVEDAQGGLDCVLHHHERWDGSGYPHGLLAGADPARGAHRRGRRRLRRDDLRPAVSPGADAGAGDCRGRALRGQPVRSAGRGSTARDRLERRPDLELRARAAITSSVNSVVVEWPREVGGLHALRDCFERRLADRAAGRARRRRSARAARPRRGSSPAGSRRSCRRATAPSRARPPPSAQSARGRRPRTRRASTRSRRSSRRAAARGRRGCRRRGSVPE